MKLKSLNMVAYTLVVNIGSLGTELRQTCFRSVRLTRFTHSIFMLTKVTEICIR